MSVEQQSRFLIKRRVDDRESSPRIYLCASVGESIYIGCDNCKTIVGYNLRPPGKDIYFVHLEENWREHKHHYSWNSKKEGEYSVQYCWACTEVMEIAPVI